MRRTKTKAIILAAAVIATTTQQGSQISSVGLRPMLTTAYCCGTTTATGTPVREGVCAVNKERLGLLAIVYEDNNGTPGALIGYFECEDTGKGGDKDGDGIGSIEAGHCIDIYRNDLEGCKEYMKRTGGKCWVEFVDAKG